MGVRFYRDDVRRRRLAVVVHQNGLGREVELLDDAGEPVSFVLTDCDFYRTGGEYAGVVAAAARAMRTADRLWNGASPGMFDWYAPDVPLVDGTEYWS